MDRRTMVLGSGAALGFAALWSGSVTAAAKGKFPVTRSDAEWRKRLTPQQYAVLRQEDTERAGSSPLDKEKRIGTFFCAGCDNPVFSSKTKFESNTGWPSFYAPITRTAIGTRKDTKLFIPRTEVHCARCGGHLGHVFDDGPKPTGLRYCMNGLAMKFRPA